MFVNSVAGHPLWGGVHCLEYSMWEIFFDDDVLVSLGFRGMLKRNFGSSCTILIPHITRMRRSDSS